MTLEKDLNIVPDGAKSWQISFQAELKFLPERIWLDQQMIPGWGGQRP